MSIVSIVNPPQPELIGEPTTWLDFIYRGQPDKEYIVSDLFHVEQNPSGGVNKLTNPQPIQLYCIHNACETVQVFDCKKTLHCYSRDEEADGFITYLCRNCRSTEKRFALIITPAEGRTTAGQAILVGEFPKRILGSTARIRKLLARDPVALLEFDQGLKSESKGLGVGAFTYYRRVVWREWKNLLGDILSVAEQTHAGQPIIDHLKHATQEPKFTAAVNSMESAIPPVLLIDGQHNPLKILHDATSAGLHDLSEVSDQECLEYAAHVRDVLTELAERMSFALKDRRAIGTSVEKLAQFRMKKQPDQDAAKDKSE